MLLDVLLARKPAKINAITSTKANSCVIERKMLSALKLVTDKRKMVPSLSLIA